jgi:rRNA maturation protein Nop10
MLKHCPVCQEETLFRLEAVYDGLRKTGERSICTQCGKALSSSPKADSPASAKDPLSALFGDGASAEVAPALFDVEAETSRLCRKCAHYVLHPFTQRCGLHDKEVQATDSCPQFEAKAEDA